MTASHDPRALSDAEIRVRQLSFARSPCYCGTHRLSNDIVASSPILDMYVHQLLNMNHFYEVLAGNVCACSLQSRIGEVSYKL